MSVASLFKLNNPIMNYAWGSQHAIAKLQDRPPSAKPEAELWLGGHSKASSTLRLADQDVELSALVQEQPELFLGQKSCFEQFPFLLKVLAAASPLSLQAHPSKEQAERGFAREQQAGVDIEAPNRNYRDPNHKPELICAVSRFEALCGFRPLAESAELFALLDGPAEIRRLLTKQSAEGLKSAFLALLGADRKQQAHWVSATLKDSERHEADIRFGNSVRWARRLNELYPGDAGVLVSLLLNQVTLEPGEALYLPAGNLHAYLAGTGVELMANSDNVLRGGLTHKHVDVAELLTVLRFTPGPANKIIQTEVTAHESVYRTDAHEFELSVLSSSATPVQTNGTPEIWLVMDGEVALSRTGTRVALQKGESALALPSDSPIYLEGVATLYRARVPG